MYTQGFISISNSHEMINKFQKSTFQVLDDISSLDKANILREKYSEKLLWTNSVWCRLTHRNQVAFTSCSAKLGCLTELLKKWASHMAALPDFI